MYHIYIYIWILLGWGHNFVKSRSHLLTSNTSGKFLDPNSRIFLHALRWVTSMVWCLTSSYVPMSLGSNGSWMDVDESNCLDFCATTVTTVDGAFEIQRNQRENQLRLVVYPIIFKAFLHPKWCRISSINCRLIWERRCFTVEVYTSE